MRQVDLRTAFPPARRRRRWSDEDAINAVAMACTYEFPLSGVTYENLLAMGEIIGPSRMWIVKRFGNWPNACHAAGVESLRPSRDDRQSQWTDRDLIVYVADFIASSGGAVTATMYELWRHTAGPLAPSSSTIMWRFGSWSSAMAKAEELLEARS